LTPLPATGADVAVSETMAGISRQAARQSVVPHKKVAAGITAGPVFRRIWLPWKARPGETPVGPPVAPLPRIGSQPSRPGRWPRSSNPAPWRPGSVGEILAGSL